MKSIFIILLLYSSIAFGNFSDFNTSFLYESFANKQNLNLNSFEPIDQKLISHYRVNLKKVANSTPLIKFYIDILEKENIPVEFAILPIIESSNNPKARSSKNAVGLWQFMPETAYEFNLSQSDFNDDRTDVLKSTYAAIMYLKYLYAIFNNWDLVLAAYNWGPNHIKNALNKGLYNSDGKLNLNRLPNETKNYLISFYAYNIAIKDHFNDPLFKKYPDQEYLTKIDRQTFLLYLDQHPDIPYISNSVLEHINGFDVNSAVSKNNILVPTSIFKNFFSLNEVSFKNKPYITKNRNTNLVQCFGYTTQYNETFVEIAEKHAIKVKDLRDFNPSVRFLRPGVNLQICST